MKLNKVNRRKFIFTALLLTPFAIVADAKWLEPTWVKVRRLRIGDGKPTHRFVHFSDLHHKGDRQYLQSVVDAINSLAPDFVCFTGDIVEENKFLSEALDILSGVALLKSLVTAWLRLTPEGIGQHFEGGFRQQLTRLA